MRSILLETWGVFLGMALPFMGGFLFVPCHGREPFWSWGYVYDTAGRVVTSPREYMEQWYGANA
jgi:hypothetical protein